MIFGIQDPGESTAIYTQDGPLGSLLHPLGAAF